jgi:hypothetical protein
VSGQCALYELALEERVNRSLLVAEGRVISQSSFWNSGHTHIYTSSTVEIYKVFKGSLQASVIDIITRGGVADQDMEIISGLLELKEGEEGIFMCVPFPEIPGKYKVYGSSQGFLKYDEGMLRARDPFRVYPAGNDGIYREIRRITGRPWEEIKPVPANTRQERYAQARAPLISSFKPSRISGGTQSILTIYGDGFGFLRGTVYFTDPDAGSRFVSVPPSQYIMWTDDSIKVEVPTKAGSGLIRVTNGNTGLSSNSLTALTVPFTQTNISGISGIPAGAYHIDQHGTGGYVWRMNTGFNQNPAAKSSFIRAFNGWKCLSYINWTLGPVTNENNSGEDGVNVITFDETGQSLEPGVLGSCFSFYKGCAGNNWVVTEMDIVFASSPSVFKWYFGTAGPTTDEIDFETVALHELGHGQQLGHVTTSSDLMFYSLSRGVKRNISADDTEGARYIMQRNRYGAVCTEQAMIPLTPENCQDSLPTYIETKGVVVHQNPFHDKTLVDYLLPSQEHVVAELYNILGDKIITIKNQTEGLGIHSITIDGDLDLIPGVYILSLRLGADSFPVKLYKY